MEGKSKRKRHSEKVKWRVGMKEEIVRQRQRQRQRQGHRYRHR
jgi:hypothetical protein